jgi:hypothetical protein
MRPRLSSAGRAPRACFPAINPCFVPGGPPLGSPSGQRGRARPAGPDGVARPLKAADRCAALAAPARGRPARAAYPLRALPWPWLANLAALRPRAPAQTPPPPFLPAAPHPHLPTPQPPRRWRTPTSLTRRRRRRSRSCPSRRCARTTRCRCGGAGLAARRPHATFLRACCAHPCLPHHARPLSPCLPPPRARRAPSRSSRRRAPPTATATRGRPSSGASTRRARRLRRRSGRDPAFKPQFCDNPGPLVAPQVQCFACPSSRRRPASLRAGARAAPPPAGALPPPPARGRTRRRPTGRGLSPTAG